MTNTTTPTTQLATTPATLEEKPSLPVCVLLPDGITVAVGELAVLVDDSTIAVVVIDEVIEELGVLVGNFIVPVVGITEDKVAVVSEIDTVDIISIQCKIHTMFTMNNFNTHR